MRHLILRQFEGKALRSTIAAALLLVSVASTAASNAPDASQSQPTVQPVSQEALRKAQQQRKRHKHRTPREVIATVDPDIDVSGSVGSKRTNVGIGYNYSVSPSYQSGLYSRTDRWHPDASIQLIPGVYGIAGGEITLVRQFKSKREAIHAKPSLPLSRLPFSSENALAMEAGSIMMIPVRLEVFEGVEASSPLAGPLNGFGRAGHVDRGSYQVQVQRLAGNKVRLRVLATRQHGFEAEGGVRLGLLPTGKRVVSATRSRGSRNLVASEYVFDLGKADSAKTYDDLFKDGGLRPRASLANPFMSTEGVAREINEGLSSVDRMAAQDAERPASERRISQSFKSVQTANPNEARAEVNLMGLAGFRHSSSFSRDSRLTYDDENNVRHTTWAPTAETTKRVRMLFGLRNEEEIRRASIIAKTSPDGSPIGTGEYVVTLELKDKRMGRSETDKARAKLARLISPSILSQLKIEPLLTQTAYKNARVYTQVVFTENAFGRIQGLTAAEIESALTAYLKRTRSPFDDHERAIRKSASLLAQALDPRATSTEKINTFATLQKEHLFRETGSGFLMSLLPENELENLVSVYIRVDSETFGANPVLARFGHSDFKNLERATECAGYQQDRSTIDLRLEDLCAGTSETATAALSLPAPAASPAAAPATSVR